jgi:hypothetical protein
MTRLASCRSCWTRGEMDDPVSGPMRIERDDVIGRAELMRTS